MKRHSKMRVAAASLAATAVLTGTTGQAWAAPAQPGTVKPSEKPAQQPGTAKPSEKPEVEAEPDPQPVEPEVERLAPAPQPVRQEVQQPAPAPQPVEPEVQQPAPEQNAAVTPVRDQRTGSEVASVREKNITPPEEESAVEFRTANLTTEEDDQGGDKTTGVDAARTEEEEDAENLPEREDATPDPDEDDETASTGEDHPASAPQPVEQPAPAPQPAVTGFSGGAGVSGTASGAEVNVGATQDTSEFASNVNLGGVAGAGVSVNNNAEATTTVQGQVNLGGQNYGGEIQGTALDSETFEFSANGGTPVEVEVPEQVTEAVEQVTQNAEQAAQQIPEQVTEAAEQTAQNIEQATQQALENLPPNGAIENALPAGLTASAWYETQ